MADQQSNITNIPSFPRKGMNMDTSISQLETGEWSYSLNGVVENYDGQGVNLQNEPCNIECLGFPEGYKYIGGHYIQERYKHIFFLANPDDGGSEIGYMDNNDCIYHTLVNDPCLNFNINHPIHKIVHKITNCSTEIYWADWVARRFMDIDNIPYKSTIGDTICDVTTTKELDCNKLKVQPNFDIPQLEVVDVIAGGNNVAGTYQYAIAYSDVAGDQYTSYYSVTNPLPLFDEQITTLNFNYPVGKSIVLNISNIDVTGYFKYFNLAVIKTINDITSVELVGTYTIDGKDKQIIYTGQNVTQIKLTVDDIFERFPFYEVAGDITAVQGILVWDQLTSMDRTNYQSIANKIRLYWETWRIPPTESYADELNAANLRGYLRDEVYPFEIVFLLKNGRQTDGFHIPGRIAGVQDLIAVSQTNEDFIGEPDPVTGTSPRWKIYNTASVIANSGDYSTDVNYKGPYQYGNFSYWESTETYPCNDIYGELSGQPIRHHKFPDCLVSPHFESSEYQSGIAVTPVMENKAIFPIGVKLDVSQILSLIATSDLTSEQKDNIAGFKIVRGDRATNKSIVAKGILRNVGKYEREGTSYYFPNYPYNDLREDPFLLQKNNAYYNECGKYTFTVSTGGLYQYTDCFTNKLVSAEISDGSTVEVCSLTVPTMISATLDGDIEQTNGDLYRISVTSAPDFEGADFKYTDPNGDDKYIGVGTGTTIDLLVQTTTSPLLINPINATYTIIKVDSTNFCYPDNLSAFEDETLKYKQVFNSPETSFGNPFLGEILKLENVIFGGGRAHFTQVKNNAQYRLMTYEAQNDAATSSWDAATLTGDFNSSLFFAAYQSYLQIYNTAVPRRNYGWSYNSIASYNYFGDINNDLGIKQRTVDYSQYLSPTVQSVGDTINLNNYNRESSVFISTDPNKSSFLFPSETPSLLDNFSNPIIEDKSRYIASQIDCVTSGQDFDISTVCYYASFKNTAIAQWGQLYSYNTIDTGFQFNLEDDPIEVTIFGGDTFISKFAFKIKLPFFIDNRVGANDDSDVFYDEIGNVAYPQFWHSSRTSLYDFKYQNSPSELYFTNLIAVPGHYLDCPNSQQPAPDKSTTPVTVNPDRTFYDGKMYMFAYGIPSFYCESSVNVDLRQAFNNREGDFWPHVSKNIPDDWVQEFFVPIAQDNTYYYNITYSKQNKENFFSHLPDNWTNDQCFTNYPFRAIYSDEQQSFTDNRINSWLIYKPTSYFDFPQNYGNLISLDGIQNKGVLARFENKSLLYNVLLTISTSNPQAAYLGNESFFKASPPIDFAETDLGFVGSQNKFLLKIPQGQVTVDAKRGQVFLIADNRATDLGSFGSGVNRFLTNHLPFEILEYFSTAKTDNHFNGVGLHGVYDANYDRLVISKLDYIPLSEDIKYDEDTETFYIEESPTGIIIRKQIYLTDSDYFCNRSWTLSFNLNTKSWISFHSYIPNFYIAENNFFYSGINESCDLEAIAAEIIPTTTTTTSTTIFPFSCELEGFAYSPNCDLEGNAIGTTTTTTTTTTTSTTTTTLYPYGDFEADAQYGMNIENITADSGTIPSFSFPRNSGSPETLPMVSGFTAGTTFTVDLSGSRLGGINKTITISVNAVPQDCSLISADGAQTHFLIVPGAISASDNITITINLSTSC